MNHRNCCSLTCCALTLVGFGLSPLHAQVPTAASAPPDASTPAASADTASLIAQAQADQKAGRFAEALALLQPLSPPVSPADTKALQRAIAHVQFGWAESLLDNSPQQALPHYQSALDIDRTLRPAQSASDLNKIGIAYAKLRQYSKALVFFQQAQTLHQQAGDKAGEVHFKELLPDLKTPFALFASNALGLAGAWRAISEAHIDHAGFALACFDEPYFECPEDVLLIKVIQPLAEICRKSVEIVMSRRGGSSELSYVSIAPEIRMSCVRERSLA